MMEIVKEFDSLPIGRAASRLIVSPSTPVEISEIYPPFAETIGGQHASLETILRVQAAHPYNAWSIRSRGIPAVTGLYLMIMLNENGHEAVLNGSFNPVEPDQSHLGGVSGNLSAIYKWGVFARGFAVGAIPLVAAELRSPEFRKLDLYGRAATPEGRRMMETVGFLPDRNPSLKLLYKYERLENRRCVIPPLVHKKEMTRA